jgi:hypothetical protein
MKQLFRGNALAIRRQRVDALASPAISAIIAARSNATQAITLECVKCWRPPRTSQMPSSGSRHIVST